MAIGLRPLCPYLTLVTRAAIFLRNGSKVIIESAPDKVVEFAGRRNAETISASWPTKACVRCYAKSLLERLQGWWLLLYVSGRRCWSSPSTVAPAEGGRVRG